jgi:hypothetical protein
MKSPHPAPPRLAVMLLELVLPDPVSEHISGDLQEEFSQLEQPLIKRQLWFWRQSISACWRYSMNRSLLLSSVIAVFSLIVCGMMMLAVVYLSNGDDEVFYNSYWTTGAVHNLFFEPLFWQAVTNNVYSGISISLFINIPSIVWSSLCLGLLLWNKKRERLTISRFTIIAVVSLFSPYLFGVIYFQTNIVLTREAGPIIAFMWLPIVYLIIPLSYGLLKMLNRNAQ